MYVFFQAIARKNMSSFDYSIRYELILVIYDNMSHGIIEKTFKIVEIKIVLPCSSF